MTRWGGHLKAGAALALALSVSVLMLSTPALAQRRRCGDHRVLDRHLVEG
jgi:hypothetical protein